MLTGLIIALGLPLGALCFVLYQILKDPNKAEKYKALFISPFYKIGKWGAKKYIGAEVSYQVTEFFNRHMIRNIANVSDVKINVSWVESPEDPILKEDNTVIVCLRKTKDQARNILNAAQVVLPVISHPYLRANLDHYVTKSIDLVSLKILADKLGNHGAYALKKHFLDPQFLEDDKIQELFQRLVQIDNRGFFVSIFLNELEYINEGIYATADSKNRTEEIINFINYLIDISKIEVGDEVNQWHYTSEKFSIGIILLANNIRMVKQGIKPYIDRVNKNLRQGIESLYILSEENSWTFLKRYEEALSSNDRVIIKGRYDITGIVENNQNRKSKVKILLLRKIDILADDLFKEKINASSIVKGSVVKGEVIDVSEEVAIVNALGIDGFIKKNQCSWYNTNSCEEILNVGEKKDFIVKAIDDSKSSLELSLLFPETHPWNNAIVPAIGSEVKANIIKNFGNSLIGLSEDGIELILPLNEISWNDITYDDQMLLVGQEVNTRVIALNNESKKIIVSIKNLQNDPWPEINKQIKIGTHFVGKVKEVRPFFVKLEIKEGIFGIIPKERLIEAGGAYADYTNNIVIGQGIDVVVTRVFVAKMKIHLDLKQNFDY